MACGTRGRRTGGKVRECGVEGGSGESEGRAVVVVLEKLRPARDGVDRCFLHLQLH